MRSRVLVVGLFLAALGCGGTPDPGPIDTATEKAAEEQLKSETAREGKAQPRTSGKKPPPVNPDDED